VAQIPRHLVDLEQRIYDAYSKKESGELMLTRIGASGIGEDCVRAIWYDWRGSSLSSFDGRLLRLFKTGYIQEDRVVQDLKDAGLQVWEVDPETGKQWTYTAADGHFVAKLDGVVKGVPGAEKTPHTLEIKSSNVKGFKELQTHGVQKAKPQHYAQMQAGLWLTGLDRALYVAVCKDDERFYIERVAKDDAAIADIQRKLEQLTTNMMPPPRIAESQDDWRCRFCDNKAVCWRQEKPLQNCRTCQWASTTSNGEWYCGRFKEALTYKKQHEGCDLWDPY